MGHFAGHVFPGSAFMFFGLWTVWHMMDKFYRRKRFELLNKSNGEPVPLYVNRISFPIVRKTSHNQKCCTQIIPVDSALKILSGIIILCEEVDLLFDKDWANMNAQTTQHVSMISLFAISGVAEVCIHYGVLKIPVQSEYLFTLIALVGEFVLFTFHLHGRSSFDAYLHLLLVGTIGLGVVLLLCEVMSPHQPIYGLMRCWTYLMQGTWFCQIAVILYPTSEWMRTTWDESAPESRASAANLFAYHMIANLFVIILIVILGGIRHRSVGSTRDQTTAATAVTAGGRMVKGQFKQENNQLDTLLTQQSFTGELNQLNYRPYKDAC
uniref:Transmembrane protein 45B n=1 Tax=Trichobilharzia regenti TaxID=157069 RepID=A0AA85IXN2_TRIRE|nr:unnamed protein product [Trichobilharzia regenti]